MHASPVGSEHGAIRVIHETDEIVAVCPEGEFDHANAPALGDEIDRALEAGKDLILDLSAVTFIDSSVIRVLLRASETAAGRRQAIVLQLGTAAIVERVLEIVGIEGLLPRAHDRQEALRIIQQQPEAQPLAALRGSHHGSV